MNNLYYHHHKLFGYHKRDATKEMRDFLSKYNLPDNITFLEAGGSGCRAKAMTELGAKSYYIDISDKQVELRKRDAISICGSICDYQPIKDCDLIMCMGVLQHTEHPAKALKNLAKWLKVGGLLQFFFYSGEYEYFFWVDVMRKLLPDNMSYEDMYKIIPYVNIEHLFAPINYGTYDIIRHDLELLGLEVIKEERDRTETFLVRKAKETDVDIETLHYKPELPLSLSNETKIKIIKDIFTEKFIAKKRRRFKFYVDLHKKIKL